MEREISRFRLASALVVLPASIAVLVLAEPLAAKVFAVVGLLVAVFWFVAFVRSRARLRGSHAMHLDIGPDGLTIALGDTSAEVRWSEVEAVELDEERLVIVVRRREGGAIEVPPVWEGVGLDELYTRIEGAWDGARRPPPG